MSERTLYTFGNVFNPDTPLLSSKMPEVMSLREYREIFDDIAKDRVERCIVGLNAKASDNIKMPFGIQVLSNPYLNEFEYKSEQYRFPRSKSRRIRKKWLKNKANWKLVKYRPVYLISGMFFAHANTVDLMKKEHAIAKVLMRTQNDIEPTIRFV